MIINAVLVRHVYMSWLITKVGNVTRKPIMVEAIFDIVVANNAGKNFILSNSRNTSASTKITGIR